MTKIDEWIKEHRTLPPPIWDAIYEISNNPAIELRRDVKIFTAVKHMGMLRSRLSGRGSPTPAYVGLTTLHVLTGVLGYASAKWGDWRFWKPTGLGNLFHELWHVHQCLRDGNAAMLRAYAGGVLRSIPSGKLWAHNRIPMEREAIAMQDRFAREATNHAVALAALGGQWL